MTGETNLETLIKTMKPQLNSGEFVFCSIKDPATVNLNEVISFFREEEGYTFILKKEMADALNIQYTFIAAWITLTVHSALEAVGLTAAFANALANENISCNVVAGYYHDHLFVDLKHAQKAMYALNRLSAKGSE